MLKFINKLIAFLKTKRKNNALKHFYTSLIRENDLCFDIGANVGEKSLIYLRLKAKVIAFEPQSQCLPYLKKIKIKYSNFKYEQLAIADENKYGELIIGNHIEIATMSQKFVNFFKSESIFWNEKEPVKIVTLDSQIEKWGIPEFCKIDAEGAEYLILKELSYPIPTIEFEFTNGFIDEALLILTKIDILSTYEYNYILNEFPIWKIKNWVDKETLIKIIQRLPKNKLHGNIYAKLKTV
ncbi:FkbM family methyltransferase [Tenacibaculum halocynthiae]|uniref:FkbM family methyltransferase n=1 Tax=Tenacibaculum halocynthiae TaxID=1254437 RepID=UPI003D6578E9